MGTRNHGFVKDELARKGDVPMRPVMSAYARDTPSTDLPLSYLHETEEHAYLAPRVLGYNTDEVILECQKENYYDALGKYSEEHKVEAMKRPNLCYESTVELRKKPKIKSGKKGKREKSGGCCLAVCLVLVGLLAASAFGLALLQFFGILKCAGSSNSQGATQGSTGKQSTQSYVNDTKLTARLQQLEANLTSLKMKFVPQDDQEIARIKNMTVANTQLIANLSSGLAALATDKDSLETKTNQDLKAVESRLNSSITALQKLLREEQEKVAILNTTVQELSRLHKGLLSNMNAINQTLAADVRKLSEQLETQGSKLASLNYSNTMSVSSLRSSIENEVTFRQGNDSVLQSLISKNSVITQVSIANLSSDLAALATKTNQDLKALESRLNSSIRNISLTPGPEGAAGRNGSGNMSLCIESMTEISTLESTILYAATTAPKENIIVGEFCHATIPVGVTIVTISPPDGSIGRSCTCNAGASIKSWKCVIRIWSCPRIN
ncbi:uncharacterized protein LOC135687984 isoform X3 [Rhopilema esculentum]|uniref:uncharacterized protein LOC135687984 isoform X3 n=1 Tax=Rhopilema esculentum TaxID=499914 RepID=UPI0031E1FF95